MSIACSVDGSSGMDSGNLAVRSRSSFLQIELNFYATKMAVVQASQSPSRCKNEAAMSVVVRDGPFGEAATVARSGREGRQGPCVRSSTSVIRRATIPKSESPTDNRMFIAFSVATNSRMDSGDVADPTAFDLVSFCFRIACSGFVQSFL